MFEWYPNCDFSISSKEGIIQILWLIILETDITSFISLVLGKLVGMDSVVHGAKLAFAEGSRHESVGNGVDVLML